jgi:RNA polymerase sigma-70 factor (ECF subfamily)
MVATGSATLQDPAISGGRPAEARPTFAHLYEEYFAFAWRSARRLGAPEASLDDVVQEMFMIVHQQLPKFEGRSSIKTWMFGIVLNVVRAHRRALRTKHPHSLHPDLHGDPDSLSDGAAGPLESASNAEAARVVHQLLEALDDDKREVFVLAELEQLSAPEIARVLNLPMNTVYSRLRLARQEFAVAAARYRARDEWRTR